MRKSDGVNSLIISISGGGGILKRLLCASLLGLTILGANAAEFIQTPTLGEHSAYTLTEASEAGVDSLTIYELKDKIGSYSYVDKNGEAVTKTYTTVEALPHYYDMTITAESAERLTNSDTIGEIVDHFIELSGDNGSAIYNTGTITGVIGDFLLNTGTYGAILNEANGTIEKITGDFIQNIATEVCGAIFNAGKIIDISANFINNSSESGENDYGGGAIYNNSGQIDNITGIFINNYLNKSANSAEGGAIKNFKAEIGNVSANFIDNYVQNDIGQTYGGAIMNLISTIDHITGDFVGNYALSDSVFAGGGAISNNNQSLIGDIKGNFIENYAKSDSAYASGGAISNVDSAIGDITGNFIGNYVESEKSYVSGGAILNSTADISGTIDNITGDFIANYVKTNGTFAQGGAIANGSDSFINKITGNFVGNYAESNGSRYSYGGAIYNSGTTNEIVGNFIANYVKSSRNLAFGGAILVAAGTVGNITGDFISNYAQGYNGAAGGAIFINTSGIIENVVGNFVANYTKSDNNVTGGAIYNGGKMGNITGNFISNHADSTNRSGSGGAIYNKGKIDNITGDSIQNAATTGGGAIENSGSGVIGTLSGNFIENSAGRYGGAIDNYDATIETITGQFLRNTAVSETEDVSGGAINNDSATIGNIVNSDFIGNSAVSAAGEALGGAIYSDGGSIALTAKDGYTSTFKDNYTESAGERKNNAIYLTGDAVMDFKMENGGKFLMADGIDGTDYKLSITGDDISKTRFYLYNTINSGDVTLSNTTIDMVNRQIAVNTVNNLTIGSDTNLAADVDLANKTMDRFTSPAYGTHSGNLTVSSVNLLSDGKENVTAVLFADEGLKDNAGTTVKTAYTPIYKYDVSYDNRDDAGYMLFTRGGAGSNSPDSYNPAVLNGAVSTIAAGQATINETFKYVFEHADAFTQLPAVERMAQIKNDYYALSTDYNTNLDGLGGLNGGLAPEFHNDGAWVRPYVTFESMNLKNGPDVDAITYGTLIGFDSDFEDFGHGWTGVTTGYVGYNGSQLNYSGNDTSMNGGLLGVTQTFYKGNLWTAITASAGASVGETSTMYGSEDFTSLLAGIGSKTGYNFEFKEGKYILQPIMFLSYTFVNTFDYTNAAGVKIESDPLHTIQLNPSVRFIANLKNGWQPYASVGMVWNLLNQTDTTANGVSLPDMHVKPYVEYGLGVQKRWADKFTAFFQTMIRNGGRNGVALTGGFRWNLGKDSDETVNTENKVKKVIKSLNSRVAGK